MFTYAGNYIYVQAFNRVTKRGKNPPPNFLNNYHGGPVNGWKTQGRAALPEFVNQARLTNLQNYKYFKNILAVIRMSPTP